MVSGSHINGTVRKGDLLRCSGHMEKINVDAKRGFMEAGLMDREGDADREEIRFRPMGSPKIGTARGGRGRATRDARCN